MTMQVTPRSPLRLPLDIDVDLARERAHDETRYNWKAQRQGWRWEWLILLSGLFGLGLVLAFVLSQTNLGPPAQSVAQEGVVASESGMASGLSPEEARLELTTRQRQLAVAQANQALLASLATAHRALQNAREQLPAAVDALPGGADSTEGTGPPVGGQLDSAPASVEQGRQRSTRRDRRDRIESPPTVQPPQDIRVRATPLLHIEQTDPYVP
jgi:hypothetical protein